jgi:Mn-dependent DtxR family transcriptional regulator
MQKSTFTSLKARPPPDPKARALRAIADSLPVEPSMRNRLEAEGLIEVRQAVWGLTAQGRIALAFAMAR